MTNAIDRSDTPEEEHLREQERLLEQLTEQLASREVEFATDGVEFARFRHHYLRRFAPLYAKADQLEAELARHLAEQRPTPETRAQADAARAQAEDTQRLFEESREEARAADAEDAAGAVREPAPELKELYKRAAKAVHPDLATDGEDAERRTRLMAAVNAAYDAGDAAAIQRILDGEAMHPDVVVGDGFGARMARVIRRIRQVQSRLEELDRLTTALHADAMWLLFDQVREEWLAGGDPLADDETRLRRRTESLKAQLAAFGAAGGVA